LIKYRTCSWKRAIEKVEVIKETEKSVWLSGKSHESKVSGHRCYFDTFEEAKKHLITKYKRRVVEAKTSLECSEIDLKFAEELTDD